MLLRLIEPTTGCNWLLIAQGLRDPQGWSRFLPVGNDSDRYRFEAAAQRLDPDVFLRLRKNLLKEGVSALEYDWNVDEAAILEHAMGVAAVLGVELALGSLKAA